MQPCNTQINHGALSPLNHFLFHLFLHFFNHFLNTRRVNSTVADQTLQRYTGNFPTDWVVTTQYDSLWCVVNQNFHARSRFKCLDISALSTNNSTLRIVAFQRKTCNRIVDRSFSSRPLNGLQNDTLCLTSRTQFSLLNDDLRQGQTFCMRLHLDVLQHLGFGIRSR